MNPEEEKAYSQLMQILRAVKDYSTTDFNTIFTDLETLISLQTYLIDPLTRLEQEYYKKIADFEALDMSHASSVVRAKGTDEYRRFRKMEKTYKLCEEQIRIAKKFESRLEVEFQSSK